MEKERKLGTEQVYLKFEHHRPVALSDRNHTKTIRVGQIVIVQGELGQVKSFLDPKDCPSFLPVVNVELESDRGSFRHFRFDEVEAAPFVSKTDRTQVQKPELVGV